MHQLPIFNVNVTQFAVYPFQIMKLYTFTYKERLRDLITWGAALTPLLSTPHMYRPEFWMGVLFVWQRQRRSKFPQSPWPSLPPCSPHVSSLLYGTSCSCPFTMDTQASANGSPPCFELPEWNQTIVIDRKAEETPHLTSTHAESNYTPSASALAPAWGFQRARGERMG